MKDYMEKSLRHFINDEKMERIENSGARIWKTEYKEAQISSKPIINVAFSRYQADVVTETILGLAGYVVAIPAYWIDVDPTLAVFYIGAMIDSYLEKFFNEDGSLIDKNSNNGNSGNKGCGCKKPSKPKPPTKPSTGGDKCDCKPAKPTVNPATPPPDKDMTPEEQAGAVGTIPSFTYKSSVPPDDGVIHSHLV